MAKQTTTKKTGRKADAAADRKAASAADRIAAERLTYKPVSIRLDSYRKLEELKTLQKRSFIDCLDVIIAEALQRQLQAP